MQRNTEEELRQIRKEMLVWNIIDMPAALAVGLGLYAVFGANGNAIPEALNNKSLAYGTIAIGGIIMALCLVKTLALLKRKVQLANEEAT